MEGFTQVTPATLYSTGRGYGSQGRPRLAGLRRPAARPALPGLHLHRVRRAWPSTCPTAATTSSSTWTTPRASGASTRSIASGAILAKGVEVVTDTMDLRALPQEVLPLLERRGQPAGQHLRQVPEGLLPGEGVRRRRDRRPAQPRVPGRELGAAACRRSSSTRRSRPRAAQVPREPARAAALLLRQLLQARAARRAPRRHGRRAGPAPTPRSSSGLRRSSPATGCRTSTYNAMPRARGGQPPSCSAFAFGRRAGAGDVFSVYPLRDLGKVTVSVERPDAGRAATIPGVGDRASAYVSYRLSRVTMEGTVYTIAPAARSCRRPPAAMPQGRHATVLADAARRRPTRKPGVYTRHGHADASRGGTAATCPIAARGCSPAPLDPVDVPAGPWGYTHRPALVRRGPAATTTSDDARASAWRSCASTASRRFSGIPTHRATRASRTASRTSTSPAADGQMADGQGGAASPGRWSPTRRHLGLQHLLPRTRPR